MTNKNAALGLAVILTIAAACSKSKNDNAAAAGDVPDVAETSAPAGGRNADMQEVAQYQLNTEDFNKYAAATRKLQAASAGEDEEDDDEGGAGDGSLDAFERALEENPAARAAVEQAGLTTREYAVIAYAIMQAALADYALQQGASRDSILARANIHPANITFVQQHRSEIERLKSE